MIYNMIFNNVFNFWWKWSYLYILNCVDEYAKIILGLFSLFCIYSFKFNTKKRRLIVTIMFDMILLRFLPRKYRLQINQSDDDTFCVQNRCKKRRQVRANCHRQSIVSSTFDDMWFSDRSYIDIIQIYVRSAERVCAAGQNLHSN